jgi:hypothetical protein
MAPSGVSAGSHSRLGSSEFSARIQWDTGKTFTRWVNLLLASA